MNIELIRSLKYSQIFDYEQSQKKTEKIIKIKNDGEKMNDLLINHTYKENLPEAIKQEVEMLHFWESKKEQELTCAYDGIIEQTKLFIEWMRSDLN